MKHALQQRKSTYIKNAAGTALLFFAAIFIFAQCGNAPTGNKTRKLQPEEVSGIRIVYANIDSIMYKYNFAIDVNIKLISEEREIQSKLDNKSREIKKYRDRRLNAETFIEYKNLTQKIIECEEQLIKLKNEQMTEFNNKMHIKDKEIRDSIANFVTEYNKDKGYDFILSRFDENILYANESLDITDEIIEGLNKRYKPKE